MTNISKNMTALGLVFAGLVNSISMSPIFESFISRGPAMQYSVKLDEMGYFMATGSVGDYKYNAKSSERYYLKCEIFTGKLLDHSVSSWLFKNIEGRQDVIVCKDDCDNNSFSFAQSIVLSKFSKAYNKTLHSFDKMMNNNNGIKSLDAFFEIQKTHKMSGLRNYGYLFYAKDKESCYKKFAEIFGQEALAEYTKPLASKVGSGTSKATNNLRVN